jgi:hypothetical protein
MRDDTTHHMKLDSERAERETTETETLGTERDWTGRGWSGRDWTGRDQTGWTEQTSACRQTHTHSTQTCTCACTCACHSIMPAALAFPALLAAPCKKELRTGIRTAAERPAMATAAHGCMLYPPVAREHRWNWSRTDDQKHGSKP